LEDESLERENLQKEKVEIERLENESLERGRVETSRAVRRCRAQRQITKHIGLCLELWTKRRSVTSQLRNGASACHMLQEN